MTHNDGAPTNAFPPSNLLDAAPHHRFPSQSPVYPSPVVEPSSASYDTYSPTPSTAAPSHLSTVLPTSAALSLASTSQQRQQPSTTPAFASYLSPETASLLERISATQARDYSGYNEARSHVLNSIVTSDQLPLLPPSTNGGRGPGRPKGTTSATTTTGSKHPNSNSATASIASPSPGSAAFAAAMDNLFATVPQSSASATRGGRNPSLRRGAAYAPRGSQRGGGRPRRGRPPNKRRRRKYDSEDDFGDTSEDDDEQDGENPYQESSDSDPRNGNNTDQDDDDDDQDSSGDDDAEGDDVPAENTQLASAAASAGRPNPSKSSSKPLLPTPIKTKSGRSVNRPSQFVPSPTTAVAASQSAAGRRKSGLANKPGPKPSTTAPRAGYGTKLGAEIVVCKACERGHSPVNNLIVFCDGCGTAWHQFCHDPPIAREVVDVTDKEWICGECHTLTGKKLNVVLGGLEAEGYLSALNCTDQSKKPRLETLDRGQLINLLLKVSHAYPNLAVFPPTIDPKDSHLMPEATKPFSETSTDVTTMDTAGRQRQQQLSQLQQHPPQQPQNQHFHLQHLQPQQKDYQDQRQRQPQPQPQPQNNPIQHHLQQQPNPQYQDHQYHPVHQQNPHHPQQQHHSQKNQHVQQLATIPPQSTHPQGRERGQEAEAVPYDGYETDPPAHYPKPNHGLASTLPPIEGDMPWMIDDNFEVFQHVTYELARQPPKQ